MSDDKFTVIFKGDILKLRENPLTIASPFGQVFSVWVGDAYDEVEELRSENEKLRAELAEYKRNGIVDVTGSINYHSGYDEGVKNERERCVMIAEDYYHHPDDEKGVAHSIAAALKETGDE